jgi:putative hydroxymethylpyrimidine transport system substrate-binding protein
MRRRLTVLAALLGAALALAACGEKTERTTASTTHEPTINLMLDWQPNADHVGLYQGLADGTFKNAGLKVSTHEPANPAAPLQLLQAGKVDVAISYEPQLLLARDKGAPLVAIGAIAQRPLTSIVSLARRHITGAAQLRGRTVGTAGIPYQSAYLQTILQHAGVPQGSVKQVDVGANLVGSLLSGRVAAVLGAYWNVEAVQLREMGRRPNVIHVEKAGVPNYDELVLVTTEKELANRASALRLFVQALARGYTHARTNPTLGIAGLERADPALSPKLTQATVQASLPAFFPAAGKPWGWMTSSQWTAFGQWMLSHHLISNPAAVVGAQTNQLLAGQGP